MIEAEIKAEDVVLALGVGSTPTTVRLAITAPGVTLVVEGTPQQLRDRVYEGFSLPVPEDVPLVDFPDTIAELGS